MTASPDLGECTPEDEALVADYIMSGVVQKYLRQNHLMTVLEHADSPEECAKPENHYDLTDYFDKTIAPILSALEEACAAEGLPFVFSVQFGMDATSNLTMMACRIGDDTRYAGAPIRQMAEMVTVLMKRPMED